MQGATLKDQINISKMGGTGKRWRGINWFVKWLVAWTGIAETKRIKRQSGSFLLSTAMSLFTKVYKKIKQKQVTSDRTFPPLPPSPQLPSTYPHNLNLLFSLSLPSLHLHSTFSSPSLSFLFSFLLLYLQFPSIFSSTIFHFHSPSPSFSSFDYSHRLSFPVSFMCMTSFSSILHLPSLCSPYL